MDYYSYTIEHTVKPLAWFLGSFAGLWLVTISVGHFSGGGTLSELLQMPWGVLFGIPLVMGFTLFYAYIGTLFCIQVEDGCIRHLFLKKYVLREARIEDLEAIQKLGSLRYRTVRLHFKGGKQITPFFRRFNDGERLLRDLQKITGKRLLRKHWPPGRRVRRRNFRNHNFRRTLRETETASTAYCKGILRRERTDFNAE